MKNFSNLRKEVERECLCNSTTLCIMERKTVIRAVAFLMFVAFFVFVAGYFLGKKQASMKAVSKITQDAFADQIQMSLNKFFDATKSVVQDVDSVDSIEEASKESSAEDNHTVSVDTSTPLSAHPATALQAPPLNKASVKYQAQLLGGSQKVVRAFAERIAKRGIDIEVKRRVGKTSRGKNIVWYQAVTSIFSKKEDLDMLIASIQKTEKIDDINIVELV